MYSEQAKELVIKKTRAKHQGGGQFLGYCPAHEDNSPSLAISDKGDKLLLHCYAGCEYKDIVNKLKPPKATDKVLRLLAEATLLKTKRSYGYRYLKKRGIPIIPPGDEVYYHPQLVYHHEGGGMTSHPALLFRIRNEKDETIGVQRIYLNESCGKAKVQSPKKVMSKYAGGAIKLGTVSDEVHLCEGPETALALYKALKRPIWACVSATNLSAQVISSSVSKVHIWADKDKSGTGEREALKAAEKYAWQGLDVYIHFPPSELPDNSKSVDWLDEYNNIAVTINDSYINTALYELKLPKISKNGPQVSSVSVDFCEKIIPTSLRGWAKEVSELMQVPLESVTVPMIVALSSLIGRQVVIRPKQLDTTFEIVPNLWGAVISSPGSKKTPTVEMALEPLYRLAKRAKSNYQDAMEKFKDVELEHQLKTDTLNADYKAKKVDMESYSKKVATIDNNLEESRPIERRYILNDTTTEKLMLIHKDNPNGLMVYREELIGWFASLDKRGREEDRSLSLQSWSGKQSFEVDRINRGNLYLPHVCLSLFGNMVPSSIEKYLKEKLYKSGGDDGLLDRIQLLIYPELIKDWKRIDRTPNDKELNNVFKVYESLDNFDYTKFKLEMDDVDSIPHIHFGSDAQELYNKWITKLERRILSGKIRPEILGHISKYRSLMPSLSLVFHMVDQSLKTPSDIESTIQSPSVKRAIYWCRYLESQLHKIYDIVIPDKKTSSDALLTKIYKGKVVNGNRIRDIYRHGWSLLDTKDKVNDAVLMLSEDNILRVDRIKGSGSESETITIHPEICKNVLTLPTLRQRK